MITSPPGCQSAGVAICLPSASCSVDRAQDFVEVPADVHRVGQRQADLLVGVDDEHRPHGLRAALLVVDHVVKPCDPAVGIGHDGKRDGGVLRVVDVLDPEKMLCDAICRQAKRFYIALLELGGQLRCPSDLGRADGGEIAGVAEEEDPSLVDPVVKADFTRRCFSGEVWGGIADMKSHGGFPSEWNSKVLLPCSIS